MNSKELAKQANKRKLDYIKEYDYTKFWNLRVKFINDFARKGGIKDKLSSSDPDRSIRSLLGYDLSVISDILAIDYDLLDLLISNYMLIKWLQFDADGYEWQECIYNKLCEFYIKKLFSLKFDESEEDADTIKLLADFNIDKLNQKVNDFSSTDEFKEYQNQCRLSQGKIHRLKSGQTKVEDYPAYQPLASYLGFALLSTIGIGAAIVIPWVMWTFYPIIGMAGVFVVFATLFLITVPAISIGAKLVQDQKDIYSDALNVAISEQEKNLQDAYDTMSAKVDAESFFHFDDEITQVTSKSNEIENDMVGVNKSIELDGSNQYSASNRMLFFNAGTNTDTGSKPKPENTHKNNNP